MTPDEPETTAVAVRGAPEPLVMIQSAIQQGLDPDKLTKLFELQERHEKAEAARCFADAITAFQADCPPIQKSRVTKNKDGSPRYRYANYEDLWEVVGPILARHKIAVNFSTEELPTAVVVTCRVRVGIHVETSAVTLPHEAGGSRMTDVQAHGSTVSYGKRYSLVNALNLVIVDEDDDGATARGQRQAAQQQPDPEMLCQQAVVALDDAGDLDYLARVWGQIDADRKRFSGQQWDRILDAHTKAKAWLTPKPEANLSLTEILTRMHKAALPADATELCSRLKWLAGALGRRLPDFSDQELYDVIDGAVLMPSSGRLPDLARDQCGPAWVAVRQYVEGAAKQPQKAGAA